MSIRAAASGREASPCISSPGMQTSSTFWSSKKNHGKEEQRARDLFYGMWIPDLFMKRVKENGDWTLFCPNEAYDTVTEKGLMDTWGEDFEKMYVRLEADGK